MKKVSLLFLLLSVFILNAYSWYHYNLSFMINGTIYPFPMNYSISDLQIKGDVSEVSLISHEASIRLGEEKKLSKTRDYLYKFENGRLLSFKRDNYLRFESSNEEYTFEYNPLGRLCNIIVGDGYGSHSFDINYSYDEKGRLNKVVQKNRNQKIISCWVFEYTTDKNFKISEYDGRLDGELVYEYFYIKGLLIKDIRYSSSIKKSVCTYSYNPQRRLIKRDFGGDNFWIYTYNQKGWDANCNYTTDSKGNWTLKREKGKPGSSYELTERKITYK